MQNLTSIPDNFLCPITREIMSEPVVDSCGNTHEKDAIERWLETNNKSSDG